MALKFNLSAIDGLDNELAQAAGKLERLVGSEKTKSTVKRVLRPLTDDAKARIHSLTGHLRDSIETRVETYADRPTQIEVGISYKRHKKARHAHLVEGGHGGPHPAPPHPFWEPAVLVHGQEAVDAVNDVTDEIIDQLF